MNTIAAVATACGEKADIRHNKDISGEKALGILESFFEFASETSQIIPTSPYDLRTDSEPGKRADHRWSLWPSIEGPEAYTETL